MVNGCESLIGVYVEVNMSTKAFIYDQGLLYLVEKALIL